MDFYSSGRFKLDIWEKKMYSLEELWSIEQIAQGSSWANISDGIKRHVDLVNRITES